MTQRDKHDLLGFLLGALDHDAHERVEQAIEEDKTVHDRALGAKKSLRRMGLDCRPDHDAPPPGLAQRTCRWVFASLDSAEQVKLAETAPAELDLRSRSSAVDFSVAVASLLVAAAVFFPALQNSHFQAGVTACQLKLKDVGFALHQYSDQQPDKSFPRVEVRGNRAAAGVYAPVLVSNQLVEDRKAFICPQSALAKMLDRWDLPTLEELDDAVGDAVEKIQLRMGGSFGYNLGHVEDRKYVPPVNRNREFFALLGDMPNDNAPHRFSENHGGKGQNVFFEDGHVQFVSKQTLAQSPMDDPFFNRQGLVAAGLDPNDAVLGGSAARPVTQDLLPMIDME